MTQPNRSLAVVLAAAIVSLLWIPTLSTPARAETSAATIQLVELA